MDKKFGLVLLAVFAIVGGLFFFTRDETNSPSSSSSTTSNHSTETEASTVELIEYGDFQCPACASFYPIVEEVRAKYGNIVNFTFRNFPLVSIHSNALAAHRAAEAASVQGKFFEMYDLLYKNQTSWTQSANPVPVFEVYAEQLDLDITRYKADFASEKVNDVINADIKEGKDKYGVNSTPTFILNGKKLDSNEIGSLELFSKKIEEAIATKIP